MLTFFFTDKNGKRCEIKNVLTAEISADVDVPADELVMTVPYDEKFGNADMLEAYDGKSLVFVGQADEIVSENRRCDCKAECKKSCRKASRQ